MSEPRTQSSLSTRISIWWKDLSLGVQLLLGLNLSLFILGSLVGLQMGQFCMNAVLVTLGRQVYRILTSSFLHLGILHIAFNMMTFVAYGPALEKEMGTTPFLYVVMLFGVFGNCLSILISYVSYFAGYDRFMFECGVGFSGILFGIIVVDNSVNRVEERSVLGLFKVPSKYYPWALLLFFQLIMPSVSFLGHLCGLLSGYAYVLGFLKWTIPRSDTFGRLERTVFCNLIRSRDSFVPASSAVNSFGDVLPTSYVPLQQNESPVRTVANTPPASTASTAQPRRLDESNPKDVELNPSASTSETKPQENGDRSVSTHE